MRGSFLSEDSSKGLSHTRWHNDDQTAIRIKHNHLRALWFLTRYLSVGTSVTNTAIYKDIFLLNKKSTFLKKITCVGLLNRYGVFLQRKDLHVPLMTLSTCMPPPRTDEGTGHAERQLNLQWKHRAPPLKTNTCISWLHILILYIFI